MGPSPNPSVAQSPSLKLSSTYFIEDLYIRVRRSALAHIHRGILTSAIYQVDDTLFKIDKREFTYKSRVFRDKFKELDSHSRDDNSPVEGSCMEHPLILEGVTVQEMDTFLDTLCGR